VRSFQEISFQAKAAWKRFTSTFKTQWTIEDYPVNIRFHHVSETFLTSRDKQIQWTATVTNWPGMAGGGNTRLEALEDLRKHFGHCQSRQQGFASAGHQGSNQIC
jgi:hypothetical protein